MGEKKIREYLTFKDLIARYGWSESFFYKKAKVLEPALLKFGGKAPKPYRYDADMVDRIICAGEPQKQKPIRTLDKRNRLKAKPSDDDGDDDLWR